MQIPTSHISFFPPLNGFYIAQTVHNLHNTENEKSIIKIVQTYRKYIPKVTNSAVVRGHYEPQLLADEGSCEEVNTATHRSIVNRESI